MFDISNILFTVPWFGYGVSLVELWSTILGLWCVIAFRKNSIWAYPIGIINSIGFIAIFYQVQLYSDLLLNIFFIVVSIVGWYWWSKKDEVGDTELRIQKLSTHSIFMLAGVILAFTFLLATFIDPIFTFLAVLVAGDSYVHIPAELPFWDAATTIMSIAAMLLLTRKYYEAWILWTLVNIICIGVYAYKGVYFMSLEYLVFLANSVLATYQWRKQV